MEPTNTFRRHTVPSDMPVGPQVDMEKQEHADGFLGPLGMSSGTLTHRHKTCPGLLEVVGGFLAEHRKQLYSAGLRANLTPCVCSQFAESELVPASKLAVCKHRPHSWNRAESLHALPTLTRCTSRMPRLQAEWAWALLQR